MENHKNMDIKVLGRSVWQLSEVHVLAGDAKALAALKFASGIKLAVLGSPAFVCLTAREQEKET